MASWKSSSVSTCGIQIPREEEPTGGGLWFLSAGSTFKRGTLRSSNPEVGNHDGGKGALLLWLSLLQLANKQKVQIPLWIKRETMLSFMRELGWGGEQNPCIPAGARTRWRAAFQQHPFRSWDCVESSIPPGPQHPFRAMLCVSSRL